MHVNGNVSFKKHFWIFAFGGNEYQWTNLSLCAEGWISTKLPEEQEQNFHFDKKAGFGMFYALYISLCSVDI